MDDFLDKLSGAALANLALENIVMRVAMFDPITVPELIFDASTCIAVDTVFLSIYLSLGTTGILGILKVSDVKLPANFIRVDSDLYPKLSRRGTLVQRYTNSLPPPCSLRTVKISRIIHSAF